MKSILLSIFFLITSVNWGFSQTVRIGSIEVAKFDLTKKYKFQEIKDYLIDHPEWRLPTIEELQLIYENQNKIGGFRKDGFDYYFALGNQNNFKRPNTQNEYGYSWIWALEFTTGRWVSPTSENLSIRLISTGKSPITNSTVSNNNQKSSSVNTSIEEKPYSNNKKELVYKSILNTSSKEWQTEFNQIKAQSNEIELATKRIELYNTIIAKYDNESIKLNVRGKENAVEEYNLIRENTLFLISQKSVIKKILKSLKNAKILIEQKGIDKSIAYCVKDKNNVISCVYVKYNGKWSCCKIFDNNEKVNLVKLISKNEIPQIDEQSKTTVITSLTGLDENYFSYTSKKSENTKMIENFFKNNTKVENIKYKYIGSFNSDGTKKWGVLLDEDMDTIFVGKWEMDFPKLENGKTFIYNYSEQKVFLEKSLMIFCCYPKKISAYVGQIGNSCLGTTTYNDGSYYIGNYLDGKRNGYGSYFWENGHYEGQWVKGERTGEGIFYFKVGEIWSGEWVNGQFTGMGKKTFKNGQVEEGLYENDRLIKSLSQIEAERKAEIERIEREKIEEQNRIEQEKKLEQKRQEQERIAMDKFYRELNAIVAKQQKTNNKSNSNNNISSQSSQKSSSSQQYTNCYSCNGSGKCRNCTNTVQKNYLENCHEKRKSMVNYGYLICNGCYGYGYKKAAGNCEGEACHNSSCHDGWVSCQECNYGGRGDNLGQCQDCKGTGRKRY